jgi:hypothetical protein
MTPECLAHEITRPILLIHGSEDGPPVEATLQSREFFKVHYCRARESQLSVADEVTAWCDRYAQLASSVGHNDSHSQAHTSRQLVIGETAFSVL